MQSKNQFEYIGIVFNLREKPTAKGWIYSFSIPISKMEGETELKEWMSGAIFSKEQVSGLKDRCDVHFTANITVNAAYNDRPQSIGFFGFEIEPIFGKVYKVSKPKRESDQQPAYNGGQPNQDYDPNPKAHSTSNGSRQHHLQRSNMQEPPSGGGEYIDGNGIRKSTFPDMAQSDEIPFAPIGMSEGKYYVHLI